MASGWWDNDGSISGCVAAYQPIGAASLAASYSNLQNPGTYDAAPGTAPTFLAATGWTFNAATPQYLNTGVTPSSLNWTVIVRYSGNNSLVAQVGAVSAGTSTGAWVGVYIRWDSTRLYANGTFKFETPTALSDYGVMAVAGSNGYHDATLQETAIGSGTIPTANFRIGTGSLGIGVGSYNIQAVAIYSATLTAGNVATLTTRMNALPVASGSPLPLFAAQMMAMR